MSTHPRPRERGTILVFVVVIGMAVMGLVLGFMTIARTGARQSEAQVDYGDALHAAETGLHHTLMRCKTAEITSNGTDLVGFVGSSLDGGFDPEGTFTRTVSGMAEGIPYQVRVRSAYFAWNGAAGYSNGGQYFRRITKEEREDAMQPLFDVYDLVAVSGNVGADAFRRGLRATVEMRKRKIEVPAPLYVHDDPNPEFGGNFNVSGLNHHMVPDPPCPTCGGSGADPGCATCGGDGVKPNGRACNCSCPNPDCNADITGPIDEEDFRNDDGNDKPAFGWDGDYDNIISHGYSDDQLYTVGDDGHTVYGEDAHIRTTIDLREMASAFVGGTRDNIQMTKPGVLNYDRLLNNYLGTQENFEVVYIGPPAAARPVSLHEANTLIGGGVLVVDGDMNIAGQLIWYGMVIVLGDLKVTGGGNSTHIFGSIMAESQSEVTGNADIWWSQEAIDRVMEELDPTFRLVLYPKVWRVLDKAQVQALGF